ncbi:hypothetical protein PanWU01x14_064760 [Parasponia andersonii]|uniref:Uncharacterized protein n=1 Tax=Parasponia andersonii TaxID=3476 RepID=A0A2P5DHE9_PARAD|nr:hypothetical protein PanWU01x14_064760 [Parasponia andersonii]
MQLKGEPGLGLGSLRMEEGSKFEIFFFLPTKKESVLVVCSKLKIDEIGCSLDAMLLKELLVWARAPRNYHHLMGLELKSMGNE